MGLFDVLSKPVSERGADIVEFARQLGYVV